MKNSFVAAAGVATAALIPAATRGANSFVPPNERITIGVIGTGGMGNGHLQFLAHRNDVELVAVCDPDAVRLQAAHTQATEINTFKEPAGTYRACTAYRDYRELLARPDIDAVVIVTPDHWHALITIEAAKAGKDIYCEKPVSLTIQEGRRLVSTVQRYGRVFQTGTQYRSIPDIRRACQFIRDGGLGQVKSVFTIYRSIDSQLSEERFDEVAHVVNAARFGDMGAPLDFALPAQSVPEGLDWNLWVGPAPWRDYHRLYHANPTTAGVPWSFDEAFGTTASTQYFSHSADGLQWALGYERSGPVEIIHPNSGRFPTVTCRYANGTLLHLVEQWDEVKTLYGAVPSEARLAGLFGAVFVGERGWLTTNATGGRLEGEPESLFQEMDFKHRSKVNIGSNNHHANWLQCIRTRQAPSADEEIGHRSASLGHLINIAFATGQSLRWDPAHETFLGNDAANRLRARAMRSPWRM